ncbi:MAG: TldD/PmbA family protein [Methanolinea sp.]|jgi:TldD protein|nr:TldD/PmbA family protein [Methanolinea sp.]
MTGVRYFDVRHVTGTVTHIDIDNTRVESAGTSFVDRAILRVLGPRGWGILAIDHYTRPGGRSFQELLEKAGRLASLTGQEVILADVPTGSLPVPHMKEDPGSVDIQEKQQLLAEVEKSARIEGIRSTRASYIERLEEVRFEDSSGNESHYTLSRSGYSILAVAGRGSDMQMGYQRKHTLQDFNLRHRQEDGRVAAGRAIALLDARAPRGGTMHAVLDPELAGVFAHEAVGHASEADLVQEGSSVLGGTIGERIGSPAVTIVDDPSLPEFGFEPLDAEGSRVSRTEIIREGVVQAFLHSRETLAAVGHGHAGNARAMPGEPPQVRMSNTYIENGDSSFEEMIRECRSGILLKGTRGGQVDPGRGVFQFNAEYGYHIEDGEVGAMVRDVSLSGEILQTLHSISLCARDRSMHQGYCGKGGQSVPVSDGAPHVLLMNAVVGGSGSD